MLKLLTRVVAGVLITASVLQAQAMEIKVPLKSGYERPDYYPVALLRFVLGKSGVDYTITFNDVGVATQARNMRLLARNTGINLDWYGTSAELERELLPVRFPIWRGLLGYRVFIIHKDNQAKFDRVFSIGDLARYSGVQGLGWSDVRILEHANLLQKQSRYDLIFAQIHRKRNDYFSRGITQAYREIGMRRELFPHLAVERRVSRGYPFASFFFTSKANGALAEIPTDGFRKAYEDGNREAKGGRECRVR